MERKSYSIVEDILPEILKNFLDFFQRDDGGIRTESESEVGSVPSAAAEGSAL